ncbi:MAG: RyR domain-containing protein [Pseudomonadota bacterium]
MANYPDIQIAQMVHETLRAWAALKDMPALPEWAKAPEWMRESSLESVQFVLANPGADSGAQHAQWVAQKEADGWRWGAEKDPDRKTHPLMVPFEELPADERAKDALVNGIVRSLSDF